MQLRACSTALALLLLDLQLSKVSGKASNTSTCGQLSGTCNSRVRRTPLFLVLKTCEGTPEHARRRMRAQQPPQTLTMLSCALQVCCCSSGGVLAQVPTDQGTCEWQVSGGLEGTIFLMVAAVVPAILLMCIAGLHSRSLRIKPGPQLPVGVHQ
jgi:hypothetical protein